MTISATAISVSAGGRRLLDSVALTLAAGEVVAVVGPNGAGKSTLLKCLSGEIRPGSGHVVLNGRAISEWPPKALARQRAVLPQQSALNFPLPVYEVVALGRSPWIGAGSAHSACIVAEAMAAADVMQLAARDYMTLSGGERQRVHLARVLAQIWEANEHGPRYLLMDEPTSALDLSHQHEVLSMARRFARTQGAGVLLVLHDLNLAATYADRAVLLHNGRVHACGAIADVFLPERLREVFRVEVQWLNHPGEASRRVLWFGSPHILDMNTVNPNRPPSTLSGVCQ